MIRFVPIGLAAAWLCALAAPAAAVDLGSNLAGEMCQSTAAPAADAPAVITCGKSSDESGDVWATALDQTLPSDPNARHAAILRLAGSATEDEELDCAGAHWVGPSISLRICALKGNGWPRVVLGIESGGKVYRAQGAPSLLPVLEAAIASDSHAEFSRAEADELQHAIRQKIPDSVMRASASDYTSYGKLIENGRLAAAADNYAAAETDYRQALAIEENLFGPDAMAVGETLAELGLEASNQGRFDDAAALFRRATPIIEASANDDARARLDSYMALDAANARHYAKALAYAGNATAVRRAQLDASGASNPADASGSSSATANSGELAHSLRIEAEMAFRLGDYPRARASAEEALWIVSEQPGLPLWWRADTASLMGEINEAQDRVVQAEHDFRDARDLDLRLFGDTAPTALADFTLGEFYTRQQLYPSALEAFRAGFAIAGHDRAARAEIQPDTIVQFVAAQLGDENAKNSPERDSELFRAIQYSQASLADKAVARIAARDAAGNAGLSDLIRRSQQAERDRDLAQVDLAAEYAKVDEERNPAREQQLAADGKHASASADSLLAQVKASFPQYTDTSDSEPVELAQVQSKLAPGEALLAYVIGTNSSYALVARHDSFAALPLPVGRAALAAEVESLRGAFKPTLGRVQAFSLKDANTLYEGVFGPLANRLDGVTHVIFVPGQVLSSLPLSLLVGRAPESGHERDYQHADWLVRHFALSEVPSPRAFLSLRDARMQRNAAPRPFLGVGAPDFRGTANPAGAGALVELTNACREDGPISEEELRALSPLPETAAEVRSVAARVGDGNAVVLLGAQATEGNFRLQPLDQFAVIYFATHALLPGELHCAGEPALVLSPPDHAAASAGDDGLLNASDIAQLKLNAELVVLSACNTATDAKELGGGSLEGLSDAFFIAGAHAVLASHWEVASGATTNLMTGVFDGARGGVGVAEALRQSQLALIGRPQTAHPFYWAAFTLMGDGGPLTGATQTADARSK